MLVIRMRNKWSVDVLGVIEAQKSTFCSVVFAIARFANSPRLCNSGNFKDYDRKLFFVLQYP